jgi:hypothetical protein
MEGKLLYFAAVLMGSAASGHTTWWSRSTRARGVERGRCDVIPVDGRMSTFTFEVTSHERVEIAG